MAAEVVFHRPLVRLPTVEGIKSNATYNLYRPGGAGNSGDRQHRPYVLRAAKGHEAPASERRGTGSRGSRGRQIDLAGRRESGNRGERVIVIVRRGERERERARSL